jgi:hypothetical protein
MLQFHRSSRSVAPVAAAFLAVTLGTTSASAQTFSAGDLVVSAYGTPTSTGLIDGQAVPISLQDFTASTTATDETPNSYVVLNGIVGEYGSSSEGNIQMTGNGQDLTIAGYNATQAALGIGAYTAGAGGTGNYPGNNGDSSSSNSYSDNVGQPYGGTAASGANASTSTEVPLAQSSPNDVSRLADVIDLSGNVVSTTSFSNIYNTNNARSAYSATGSSIYISGQGDSKSDGDEGLFYSPTTGASYTGTTNKPTAIYTSNDTRYVTGYSGNLYYSLDKKNSPTGIFMYTGMPTSLSSAATQLTLGENTAAGYAGTYNSPEAFWFANSTTLYVADTGIPKIGGSAVGAGGIQKWTLTGGTWSLQYVLTPSNFVSPTLAVNATSGQTGFEAITGQVIDGTVDLYAVSYTAGDDNPNGLYAIADPLAATTAGSDTFTELAASPGDGDENFKGVVLVAPEPSTWAMLLGGLGLLAFWRMRARRLQA